MSSRQSKFYGIVKVATIGLGMKGLLDDMGIKVKVLVNTDSSEAKSIASRRGAGRARRDEARELRVRGRWRKWSFRS